MLVKSKVKYIQSLSHKKHRDEEGVFVAEGPKIINELLAGDSVELKELYALPELIVLLPPKVRPLVNEISNRELERISFLSTPHQMLAIFKKPAPVIPDLSKGLTLMLDNIQDPGNLGTIIRSADWFGVQHIICSPDCADAFGPKTIQSTMGSIARVNIVYDDLVRIIEANPDTGFYAAKLEGENIYTTKIPADAVIIIGNESKGISNEIVSRVKNGITIPKTGQVESLNAAVATGIILSHLKN